MAGYRDHQKNNLRAKICLSVTRHLRSARFLIAKLLNALSRILLEGCQEKNPPHEGFLCR